MSKYTDIQKRTVGCMEMTLQNYDHVSMQNSNLAIGMDGPIVIGVDQ